MALRRRVAGRQRRLRSLQTKSRWPRHRRQSHPSLRPARRTPRRDDRETLRRGSGASGEGRPARAEDAARDGRDRIDHRPVQRRTASSKHARTPRGVGAMKAVCWFGKTDVRVENVPDPKIINPHDAIVRVTLTAICGSDLHLYDGYIPTMTKGDILGHEFMGEVVEVGTAVTNLKAGDRVIVPFPICCGRCWFCTNDQWSLCDNTNPNAWMVEAMYGFGGAALYGYSHLYGGYAGGQAEYVRVPFADVNPLKIPDGLPDEKVLFLTDIFPTGYFAADNCDIKPGD